MRAGCRRRLGEIRVQANMGGGTRMRTLVAAVACGTAALALAAPAGARVAHTVQPGETLWSIAAASNFTTRALAAANGLPETANVQAGQTVWVPSEAEAATALAGGGSAGGTQSATG